MTEAVPGSREKLTRLMQKWVHDDMIRRSGNGRHALLYVLLSEQYCTTVSCVVLLTVLERLAMAEADWDEVTYLRKKPQRAADARSQKVSAEARNSIKSAP